MFTRIRRFLRLFLNRSRTVKNEPINRASLIVIILIDIFILINVFAGLDDISRWYISPSEAHPCYSQWQTYQKDTAQTKDFNIVRSSILTDRDEQRSFQQTFQQAQEGRLGQVSSTCLQYGEYQDKINNSANRQAVRTIDQRQARIESLEQRNRTIRAQYDSALLEKIAGQSSDRSINSTNAERAKQELGQNDREITTIKNELSNLRNNLTSKSESNQFLAFLKNGEAYRDVEKGYQQASFWYPSIQLVFQAIFLLPLILIAATTYRLAQRREYGLIALISWHLLVIFFIPLIFKIFEFLQVGVIFEFLFNIISALLGGLLFLVSYVYILLIPLLGFVIIKLTQKLVLNPKAQAAGRVQNSRCIRCARNLRHQESFCPHCGFYQYTDCPNCHQPTYKHLPYCKECGHTQEGDRA